MTQGRRADHTREELCELILSEGARLMEDDGYAKFSARKVAARIGYSVAMVLHVMGSTDHIVMSINSRTFMAWADQLEAVLDGRGDGRLDALVKSYFDFAAAHPRLWMAIYEHRLPAGMAIPPDQDEMRGRLTSIVVSEVRSILSDDDRDRAPRIARSLIATVHGHCHMWICGSMEIMGEHAVLEMAIERVNDTVRSICG